MNTKLQFTAVLANFCGLLLKQYEKHEKTAVHRSLEIRIGNGFRKLFKTQKNDIVTAIDVGDKVWRNAIDHFAKEEMSIEASTLILAIVARDEKSLGKYFGLNKGILEKWAKPSRLANAIELEKNSNKVCDFLVQCVAEELNIETQKKDLSMLRKMVAEANKRKEEIEVNKE